MFFPLQFWQKVGELACAPSRQRRSRDPFPTISVAKATEIVGGKLCAPFVPDPVGVESYRALTKVANNLDSRIGTVESLSSLSRALFQKDNDGAIRAADAQGRTQ